jgi:ABC-type branched-subunit amino acid transport system permease subunit
MLDMETSMAQQLLFESDGARVTPHIATFGGTSYQIANIGSVRVARRKKYNPLAVIIFLIGLGTLAAAIIRSRITGLAEAYFSMAVTGLAVIVAAVLLQLVWPGRVYMLVLRTSAGGVDAVVSRDKEFVSNLQKAIEQAFVVRARERPASEA